MARRARSIDWMRRAPTSRPSVRTADASGAARLRDEASRLALAGNLEAAVSAYDRAARAAPDDFRAPMSLATLQMQRGRPELALPQLRRVAALRPDLFEAHHNLGAVAQLRDLIPEAAEAYARALEIRPASLETRQALAAVLATLGRLEEAEIHHRTLAQLPQTRAWALTRLALLRPASISDAELGDMQALAADQTVELDTRTGLWFAIGETLEQRGRDEEAFIAFARGNALKRGSLAARVDTDPVRVLAAHARSAARVRETFGKDFIEARQGQGLSTRAPIFIVGMPRSGSTLIAQILGAHPEVMSLGETAELPRLLEAGAFASAGAGGGKAIARRYLEAMRGRGWPGSGRFVDKTLENYLHVGAVALMFPNAVILNAVREPMDACLSCWRQLFASGAETLYDLAEIGVEYRVHREVMDHWDRVLPGRVIGVSHEDLVADPERMIRWLVEDACQLAWSDACLDFHTASGPVRTASAGQVRQPIFRTSLGRWRRYEPHLGALREALGPYAPAA